MKAVVFHEPGHISMKTQVAEPVPAPGEVLIDVAACGICGSDLHMYRTNAHRAQLVRVDVNDLEIPGHEFSGTIAALGPGVEGYRIGERVVGVGMGGMAERVPVKVNPFHLVRIPAGVSFAAAATTEPLADSLRMIRKARIKPRENVVVFGVGIIGLGVIQGIRALDVGVGHVVAIDVSKARLQMARQAGATDVVNASDEDPLVAVKRICGTLPVTWETEEREPANVSVVFDCAGYMRHIEGPPPLQTALRLACPGNGRIICFGTYEDNLTLDMMPLVNKRLTLIGSYGYAAEELGQALQLMAEGKIERESLVSHRFALEEVVQAFEVQGSGQAIKVLLEPRQHAV